MAGKIDGMRPLIIPALISLAMVAGCGGGEPSEPQDVAGAWVEAMNEGDWERACELSVPPPGDAGLSCDSLLEEALRDTEIDMALEGLYMSKDSGSFAISRSPDGLAEFELVRQDGEWRVHFEIQIIR